MKLLLFLFILVLIFFQITETFALGCSPEDSFNQEVTRFYSPYCSPSEISQYLENTKTTKVIWSYWDSDKVPPSVAFALNTWMFFQPNFIICLLSKSTVKNFVESEFLTKSKSKQEEADVLRLLLLEKYGGYWIDSTIILCAPIEDLWEPKDYDVGGYWIPKFTTDPKHKVFENWFIVAPRHSKLIRQWKKEFLYALSFPSRAEYINNIDTDLQNIFGKEYLMMHCCFLKVTRGNHPYKIKCFSAFDKKEGPFYYLHTHTWNSSKAISDLLTEDNPKINQRMLKLRGGERDAFDSMLHLLSPESKIGKLNEVLRKNSISQI